MIALVLTAAAGCAQILGTDFDVVPLEGGGGTVSAAGGSGGGSAVITSVSSAGGAGGQEDALVTLWEGDLPYDLVVDDGYVYWSNRMDLETPPGIRGMSKQGGLVLEFVPQIPAANRLLLHDGELFYTAGDADADSWVVGSCSLVNQTCQPLVVPPGKPIGLAASADYLYFTVGDAAVYRYELGVGPEEHVMDVPTTASMLLVAHGYLWGTALDANKAWRAMLPVDVGSVPQETNIPSANGLAIYSSTVAVGSAVLNGGVYHLGSFGMPTPIADDQDTVADMVSHDNWLYWANFQGGQIMRVAFTGSPLVTLLSDEPAPNGVAVDDEYLYFTNHAPKSNGGSVKRLRLPP